MKHVLLVALGGAIGAVVRFGLATRLSSGTGDSSLPWGTITVNLVGCFVIGALVGASQTRDGVPEVTRVFLMIGVLGGFTTFSAFGLETVSLLRSGALGLAALNVGLQVVGGLVGVWAGWAALA